MDNQAFIAPPDTPPLGEAEAAEAGFSTPPHQMILARAQPPALVRRPINSEPNQREVDENTIRRRIRRSRLLTDMLQDRLLDNLIVDNLVAATTGPRPLDGGIEARILARRKRMKPCSSEAFMIKKFNDDDQPPNKQFNFRLGM